MSHFRSGCRSSAETGSRVQQSAETSNLMGCQVTSTVRWDDPALERPGGREEKGGRESSNAPLRYP